jgi:hypothetical protein
MYQCNDHDRKVEEGLKKYKECEEKVLDEYRSFAADWNATHPYLLAIGRHVPAKDLSSIRNTCVSDCGDKPGKSCAPTCQTSFYSCLRVKVPDQEDEFKTCSSLVKEKYSKVEDMQVRNSAEELTAIESACSRACGLGSDASCLPECSVQMYSCEGAKDKYTACTKRIVESYEKFSSNWNAVHPMLLSSRGHADAETLEEMKDGCIDACGTAVDSSCVPECQVKMYMCLDHDRKTEEGATEYKKCSSEVLAKYERFADDWNAAHPYLLAVHRHVASSELVHIHDKCVDVCGPNVDSSCIPECEVDMYQCLDHDRKTDVGLKLYEDCESKVVEEYKSFSKNWDEKHPY